MVNGDIVETVIHGDDCGCGFKVGNRATIIDDNYIDGMVLVKWVRFYDDGTQVDGKNGRLQQEDGGYYARYFRVVGQIRTLTRHSFTDPTHFTPYIRSVHE